MNQRWSGYSTWNTGGPLTAIRKLKADNIVSNNIAVKVHAQPTNSFLIRSGNLWILWINHRNCPWCLQCIHLKGLICFSQHSLCSCLNLSWEKQPASSGKYNTMRRYRVCRICAANSRAIKIQWQLILQLPETKPITAHPHSRRAY